MKKMNRRQWISALLCAALICGASGCRTRPGRNPGSEEPGLIDKEASQPVEAGRGDTSFNYITGHIDLTAPARLAVTRPLEDISLDAQYYYLTGCSDPSLPLYLNGEELEGRGKYGSFGVYAELEEGSNAFTFAQGGEERTVTITRGVQEPATTDTLGSLFPAYDTALRSGESYSLRCTAPSGSSVTAEIGGKSIVLEQAAATAAEGIPATYRASFIPAEADGTIDLGKVTYTLKWNGKTTTHTSAGRVFAAGSASDLTVRARDVSTTTFLDETTEDDYFTTLKAGAVDTVENIGDGRYLLGCGGWVSKEAVEPLADSVRYQNTISDARFNLQGGVETLTLSGTAPAPYHAEREGDELRITLFHTSGLEQVKASDGILFDSVDVSADAGNTTLTFRPVGPDTGYLVRYDGNDTVITFTRAPALADEERPLDGVTILLDPGHGGDDPGAASVARDEGAAEKEITLATAQAVEKYLKSLGATVRMTREGDETLTLNDRLELAQQPEIDLMLSLHCNSVPWGYDGTKPSGVEVYYYDEISAALARSLLDSVCDQTGRLSRGAKHANYKVTLNSNVPSVLVEMGFLTNPAEYDNLCDRQEIYNTAEAIAEGVLRALSGSPQEENEG